MSVRLGGNFGQRDACNVFFIKGMLMGVNLLALNVWDALRSIEYLQLRPEVDPGRIGCVGLSYGGTMTLYTAALDERVKCAVVSGYLNSFEAYAVGRGNTCGAQTPHGLLEYGESSDVGCLIAPRPLLIESGVADDGFPIEASREAAAAVRRAYDVAGVLRPVRRGRVRRRPPVERPQGLRLARPLAPRRRRVAQGRPLQDLRHTGAQDPQYRRSCERRPLPNCLHAMSFRPQGGI